MKQQNTGTSTRKKKEKTSNMNKRNYSITPSGEWFKVEVSDEYNNNTVVYEKNVIQASIFITDWWEKAEEREEKYQMLANAIYGCTKLDKELGLLKENEDNLD